MLIKYWLDTLDIYLLTIFEFYIQLSRFERAIHLLSFVLFIDIFCVIFSHSIPALEGSYDCSYETSNVHYLYPTR